MPKTSTDPQRLALNGPTMGTRWSASFYAPDGFDPQATRMALQATVNEVDAQMSTWNPRSDLMRLNAQPVGAWIDVPRCLMEVLRLALAIGRASGGAFDIGVGTAIQAWGFGPDPADESLIRKALEAPHPPAFEIVDLDIEHRKVRKTQPVEIDLNGVAKGYAVDRMAATLQGLGIASGLVGIDGEMRTFGLHPGGDPWSIAIEEPEPDRRTTHSVLALQDAAVATSGDYRHWLVAGNRRLSHTIDPRRGGPLLSSPASVTVVARTCAEADAWATALMVLGSKIGGEVARSRYLNALFLSRDSRGNIRSEAVGPIFDAYKLVGETPC
jgi:thiamine biosynthesis lipoprotein